MEGKESRKQKFEDGVKHRLMKGERKQEREDRVERGQKLRRGR